MKFYSECFPLSPEALLSKLKDTHFVTNGVHFEEKDGIPAFSVKEKAGFVLLTCRMTGGATKDNGFLVGSFFLGRIKNTACGAKLSGFIATAPLYHAVLISFIVYAVIKALAAGGITVLPFCIAAFDILLFAKEFRKQSILLRYLRILHRKCGNVET